MKAKFLKIANVKSEKEFYDKYPNEKDFFNAHPEAKIYQKGGTTIYLEDLTPEEKKFILSKVSPSIQGPVLGKAPAWAPSSIPHQQPFDEEAYASAHLPKTGIVVDKRTNTAYYVGDKGQKGSFPVLTGKNVNLNENLYGMNTLEKHPELRNTPVGNYLIDRSFIEKYPNAKPPHNLMHEYKGKLRHILPIPAYGQSAPLALNLALHRVYADNAFNLYDPEYVRRMAKLQSTNPKDRAQSFGCINCTESDYDIINKTFPTADTLQVIDSKRINDLIKLNLMKKRIGIKKLGGVATADQFFDYGMSAAGPLIAPEMWYQDGGQFGGETQYGGETDDMTFVNEFANMLYPNTEEETETTDEEVSEDESTEMDNSNYFQTGGSKSAFNYGQFPAVKKGGIQGGNIDAAGSNIKETFLKSIRKNVANNELKKMKANMPDENMMLGIYGQYGMVTGYGANYNPNLYNQAAFENAYNQSKGKTQAGINQFVDVMQQNQEYNQQNQEYNQQKNYNNLLHKFLSGEMAKTVEKPTGAMTSQQDMNQGQELNLPVNSYMWGTDSQTFELGGIQKFLPKAQDGMGWYTAEGKRVDTPSAGSTGYWDRVANYWSSVLSGTPDWQNEEWLQKGIDPATLKGKIPTVAAKKAQEALNKLNPAYASGPLDYLGNLISLPQKGMNLALTGNYETPGTTILRANPDATTAAFWADVLAEPTNLVGIGELKALGKTLVKAAPKAADVAIKTAKYVSKYAPEVAKYISATVAKYGPEALKNPYVQNVLRTAIVKGLSSAPEEQLEIQKQAWAKQYGVPIYGQDQVTPKPKAPVPPIKPKAAVPKPAAAPKKSTTIYLEDLTPEERKVLGLPNIKTK